MKIELDDRPDILGVVLDGKFVANPTACDPEEGWVEIEEPVLVKDVVEEKPHEVFLNLATGEDGEEAGDVTWKTTRLTGRVQLAFRKKP